MNLIIETGAGVEGANSYVGIQESADFASARGLSLPCDSGEIRQLAFRAMDYVESFEAEFPGTRTLTTQSTAYPRTGACVYCRELAIDEIPKELKYAQIQTMIAIHAGFDPQANVGSDLDVIEELVGPLKIKYGRNPHTNQDLPSLTAVTRLLDALTGGGGTVRFVKA